MTDEPQYLDDPMAIGVVNYLAAKGQIDASQWIEPKKSGYAALAAAAANVRARADQKRREAAEEEVRKVLDKRGTADLLAWHLGGGSVDVEPSEIPLNSPVLAEELDRILNGDD